MTDKQKNLVIRSITGVLFVACMVSCFLNPRAMVFLFALITGLSIWEYCGLVNGKEDVTVNRFITTVCLRENAVISELSQGLVKNIQTHLRTQFLLNILLRIATRFLQYLKQIDKISYTTENLLHKTMRNKELIQILGLEKSLVYFSTSLKSTEVTLEKILRGRIIKLYDADEELLEDVIIEVKQAIEMCSIYSNVLSNTMDAFASIINNNMNIVMKTLTALTMVMALPNIVFGLYGINVNDLPLPYFWFVVSTAIVLMLVCTLIFWKKGMFK